MSNGLSYVRVREGGEGWQEHQVKIEQIGGSANSENSLNKEQKVGVRKECITRALGIYIPFSLQPFCCLFRHFVASPTCGGRGYKVLALSLELTLAVTRCCFKHTFQ